MDEVFTYFCIYIHTYVLISNLSKRIYQHENVYKGMEGAGGRVSGRHWGKEKDVEESDVIFLP